MSNVLALTRRWTQLALALGSSLIVTLGAWTVLGLDSLRAYPAMLGDLQRFGSGVLVTGLARRFTEVGNPQALCLVVAVPLLALVAWRRRDDSACFALALVAALAATPVVWLHYLALLLPVIAVRKREFQGAWLALLPLWVFQLWPGRPIPIATLPALVIAVVLVALFVPWRPPSQRTA